MKLLTYDLNTMKKKSQTRQSRKYVIAAAVVLAIALLMFLIIGIRRAVHQHDAYKNLPKHTMPYVDGKAAVEQVQSFYDNYTEPNRSRISDSYKTLTVKVFGSDNLEFYYKYYLHGFDPIICSNVMPNTITAKLESTGPVAIVNVTLSYAGNYTETVKATVVLNNDGMVVDSITCPGDRGNLPPAGLSQ